MEDYLFAKLNPEQIKAGTSSSSYKVCKVVKYGIIIERFKS
jgi:hypothetical protein